MRFRRRLVPPTPPRSGHIPTCGVFGGCECELTAYHEAGHAIAAWAQGVRVRMIDLRSIRGMGHGYVWFEPARDLDTNLRIVVAGQVAEHLAGLGDGDGYEIDEAIACVGWDRAASLARQTQSLLVAEWWRVAVLARALLEGRSLIFGAALRTMLGHERTSRRAP